MRMLTKEGWAAAEAVDRRKRRVQAAFAVAACVLSVAAVMIEAVVERSASRADDRLAVPKIASGSVAGENVAAPRASRDAPRSPR